MTVNAKAAGTTEINARFNADGTERAASATLEVTAPVITITTLVLALNLLGDSVRDAFDPRTRR